MIRRDDDVVTGADDLEPLYTFDRFPISMGTTEAPWESDVFAPMEWKISRSSGAIQLARLLPLDILYAESHGAGVAGAVWRRHHESFADFVAAFAPRRVLEIGGGHGRLAAAYSKLATAEWTILEPSPWPTRADGVKYITGFFDSSFQPSGPLDAVVHSHVLEHIYNPRKFFADAGAILAPGQMMLFSVPNLERMLELGYTNTIHFEHTVLLGDSHIRTLAAYGGFEVVECKRFLDDHSLFYAARRRAAPVSTQEPCRRRIDQRSLYASYIETHVVAARRLNNVLAKAPGPVYVFGAHVFAQYLFAFGLNSELVTGILDNDAGKLGRRLYGTRLCVASPDVLASAENPVVVVRAGAYGSEIRRQLREINSRVTIVD